MLKKASAFSYVSKRKLGIVVARQMGKRIEEIKEDEYSSGEEVQEDELEQFLGPSPSVVVAKKEKYMKVSKPPEAKFQARKKYKQEVDTNIVQISMKSLNEDKNLATGDPFPCQHCGAILSMHSKSNISLASDHKQSEWRCEFCSFKNVISIDPEEIPKAGIVTYVVDKSSGVKQSAVEETKGGKDDDITVIFCIDISGSMGDMKKGTAKPGLRNSIIPPPLKKVPTRLDCVKSAIKQQINQMLKESPNRKVGFVTFETECKLLGNGTQPEILFDISKMQKDFYGLLEEAANYATTSMTKPIKETSTKLLNTLDKIVTMRDTALGPGLAIALALAGQGNPGSKVILCTDGLANIGVGAVAGKPIRSPEEIKGYYTTAANYAKQHGVSVSLITLTEGNCRLDMLSPVANLTNGDILRVNPSMLAGDFSSILSEKLIATQVEVKVKIFKALNFRNEEEKNITADRTTLVKELGNVTENSTITFEYSLKRPEEMAMIKDLDWGSIKSFPFQTQITYLSLDGKKKLRVISEVSPITFEKEIAKKAVDVDVIGTHAALSTANYAAKGDYSKAKRNAYLFSNMAPQKGKVVKGKAQIQDLVTAIKNQERSQGHQNDELTSCLNVVWKQKVMK